MDKSLTGSATVSREIRYNWTLDEVQALFDLPFNELLFQAQMAHRAWFDPNAVQVSALLSVQTGGCPEDCAYCPQSIHHSAEVDVHALMSLDEVKQRAATAKSAGATRLCMGAAWRNPGKRNFSRVLEMVRAVKEEGLEACATLGMLTAQQAQCLREAGLNYYNHNLDTSESYYGQITTTRTYQDRLNTLQCVRDAGINVCCGGIIGLGEEVADRAAMLHTLANMMPHPESIPVNRLVSVDGTALEGAEPVDAIAFVRTIAVTRILMPSSVVRLSAGRTDMSDEMQALCFFAGANSIFYGDKLLTTPNPDTEGDQALFRRLGLYSMAPAVTDQQLPKVS